MAIWLITLHLFRTRQYKARLQLQSVLSVVPRYKNAFWYLGYNPSICLAIPSGSQTLFSFWLGCCLEQSFQIFKRVADSGIFLSKPLWRLPLYDFWFSLEACFEDNWLSLLLLPRSRLGNHCWLTSSLSLWLLFSILAWPTNFPHARMARFILLWYIVSRKKTWAWLKWIFHYHLLKRFL